MYVSDYGFDVFECIFFIFYVVLCSIYVEVSVVFVMGDLSCG